MKLSNIRTVALVFAAASVCATAAHAKNSSGNAEIRAGFGKRGEMQISEFTSDNPGTDFSILGFNDPFNGKPPVCYTGNVDDAQDLLKDMAKAETKMAKLNGHDPDGVEEFVDIKDIDVKGDTIKVKYESSESKDMKKADKYEFEVVPCTDTFFN